MHWFTFERGPRTESSSLTVVAQPLAAYLQRIRCVPASPRRATRAGVNSNCLPAPTGRWSITSAGASTVPYETTSFAPHGNTGCATPSEPSSSTRPQVVRAPAASAVRGAARASYQPPAAAVRAVETVALARGVVREYERRDRREQGDRREGERPLRDGEAHRLAAAPMTSPNDSRTSSSNSSGSEPSGRAKSRR